VCSSDLSLVEDSLQTAETRAREVSEAMTNNAANTTEALVSELNALRSAAGDQVASAADELRQRYDNTVAQMSDTLALTTDKFNVSMSEMQQVAGQIADQLERTRTELETAVVNLPEQAHKNTAAMRRVIADQISALASLSDIVKRHGNVLDVSGGAIPEDTRTSRRTRRANNGQAEIARNLVSSLKGDEVDPGKWALPDLLAAASRSDEEQEATDDPERTPLHIIETLNSLSVDLARVLDHDAPADLWVRYKNGERNVFTRRLYSMRGQQIFDEISNRYEKDAEFHEDVDRYIYDFEQLLSSVAENDRENMLVETYLTSETGKVYLMLAHASGKLA